MPLPIIRCISCITFVIVLSQIQNLKNAVRIVVLLMGFVMVIMGYACQVGEVSATANAVQPTSCAELIWSASPTRLWQVGCVTLLLWCCTPCFRLEMHTLPKPPCFMRNKRMMARFEERRRQTLALQQSQPSVV